MPGREGLGRELALLTPLRPTPTPAPGAHRSCGGAWPKARRSPLMCQPGPSEPPGASVATPKSASSASPAQTSRHDLTIAGREQPRTASEAGRQRLRGAAAASFQGRREEGGGVKPSGCTSDASTPVSGTQDHRKSPREMCSFQGPCSRAKTKTGTKTKLTKQAQTNKRPTPPSLRGVSRCWCWFWFPGEQP